MNLPQRRPPPPPHPPTEPAPACNEALLPTPLPSSIQVRYGRNSRLHRSELLKSLCVSLFYVIGTGSTGSRATRVANWAVPTTLNSDASYAKGSVRVTCSIAARVTCSIAARSTQARVLRRLDMRRLDIRLHSCSCTPPRVHTHAHAHLLVYTHTHAHLLVYTHTHMHTCSQASDLTSPCTSLTGNDMNPCECVGARG